MVKPGPVVIRLANINVNSVNGETLGPGLKCRWVQGCKSQWLREVLRLAVVGGSPNIGMSMVRVFSL